MRKFFLFIFLIFYLSFATDKYEIDIDSINIKNLPDSYIYVFKDFFKENIYGKQKNISIDVDINWIFYSYNICISVKVNKVLKETLCANANFAENIRKNVENLLKNDKYLFLEKKNANIINLQVIAKGEITEKKVRLISSKGDYLSDYKDKINSVEKPMIAIGGASLSFDLIILNNISATFILNKLLNNYKINKIYVIKN